MKKTKALLVLIVFCITTLGLVEAAFARSKSLTTTILVTVKAAPESNLLPNDKNSATLEELATTQPMQQPYIKMESREDITSSGGKVYTITDRL